MRHVLETEIYRVLEIADRYKGKALLVIEIRSKNIWKGIELEDVLEMPRTIIKCHGRDEPARLVFNEDIERAEPLENFL
ncbi:hypothetical protein [Candidatus Methanodesulfokora washburnensis]|uniref:Uncharacterized protein n=1 Tax=Candidatus Methanodesulfokora washburnensis TaxID=2478471 RepID=A0A429GWR6_9CREN|nr:hypothetical protein [Candidatus Methanodesulfokores washburnensis]RSN78282.1 hypothetical protein D6D85_01345 [Candidatus Methanodesulfokores washburnensis]